MLELQHISYDVEQDGDNKGILHDISLTINERFVAITGPNGGGKSTLAKLIAGIIKPTEGRIYFDGEDITDLSISERAKKGIGYGFQQPARFKGMKVKKLLDIGYLEGKDPAHIALEYYSPIFLYFSQYMNHSYTEKEKERFRKAVMSAAQNFLATYRKGN